MKSIVSYLLASVFALAMLVVACTKSNESVAQTHDKAVYRALAIGDDTTTSRSVFARVETVGLDSAMDDKLKVVLLSYQNIAGIGHYIVQVTNPQSCQMILRWNWDGEISLFDEQPQDSTANTPQSDVLKAYQTKIYTITGTPKPGRIKVQAQHINSECPNSSTLIINITTSILPIVYTSTTTEKVGNDIYLVFSIDDPTKITKFIIQRQVNGGVWENIQTLPCDGKTKNYKVLIWDDVK